MSVETKKDRPGVIAPPPLIYLVVFLLGYALHRQLPLALPESLAWNSAGWVLIGLAVIIAASGIISMKRAGTHVDVYKPSTAIVSNGPYRFSRNPLYLALTAIYLGTGLLIAALWPLIVLPGALLIMHYGVIKREERYLTAKFGAEYLRYQTRVRRWL